MKRIILAWFLLLCCFSLFAQIENSANVWYWGQQCGFDFDVDPPEVLYDGRTDESGSAIFCDSLGNILLYIDGRKKIFNGQHLIVEGGDNLIGYGSFQALLIVPQPLTPNISLRF